MKHEVGHQADLAMLGDAIWHLRNHSPLWLLREDQAQIEQRYKELGELLVTCKGLNGK